MGDLHLTRMKAGQAPDLLQYEDRTIFQTSEWIDFISKAQGGEPVSAALCDNGQVVGQFTGLMIQKMGIRILGSPFPGWTTSYMGFNLHPGVSRAEALRALEAFAFRDLHCIHIEIMDRRLTHTDYEKAGYLYTIMGGFEVDISGSEEEIFKRMDPAARRCIRKGEKCGVTVQQATDAGFVDEYYSQLIEVFARKGLVPTYPKERVRLLVEHLLPTGRLLLARAFDADGKCIATGIFPAFNDTMYFWGGASWRHDLLLRPNEALHWFAMRYWKARGITKYDMGGVGDYKRKYGGCEIAVPWGRKSRYALMDSLRRCGKEVFHIKQHVEGFLRSAKESMPMQWIMVVMMPLSTIQAEIPL